MVKYYLFGGGHSGEYVECNDNQLAEISTRRRIVNNNQEPIQYHAIDDELIFRVHHYVINGNECRIAVHGEELPDEEIVRRAAIVDAELPQ